MIRETDPPVRPLQRVSGSARPARGPRPRVPRRKFPMNSRPQYRGSHLWPAGGITTILLACLLLGPQARAADAPAPPNESDEPWLVPYAGPTRTDVDATTLDGKVLCGYQGWFNTPGDGTNFGFTHWGQGLDRPDGGRFTVDMWPDVSEYDPRRPVRGARVEDARRLARPALQRLPQGARSCSTSSGCGSTGSTASSSAGSSARRPARTRSRHVNRVLASVREGCHREGRVWAMMLDLSVGQKRDDRSWSWTTGSSSATGSRSARTRATCTNRASRSCCYGASASRTAPGRRSRAEELVDFFKNDPKYGGVYLIGGIDPVLADAAAATSRTDPAWAKVYRSFDAISPWDAGRYRDDASMDHIRKTRLGSRPRRAESPGQRVHADRLPRLLVGQPPDRRRRARR